MLKNMCKYLIVETPLPNDNKSCGQKNLKQIYNLVEKECDYVSEEKFIRHTNKMTYSKMYFYTFESMVKKHSPYYNFYKLDPHTFRLRNIDINSSRQHNGSRDYIHIIADDIRKFIKQRQEVENYRIWEKEENNYIHGINLYTYLMLNGVYPSKSDIINKTDIITNYKWDNSLYDLNVWNMIINENVYLIDVVDKSGGLEKGGDDNLNLITCCKYINYSKF